MVRQWIDDGRIRGGQALPSERTLADELGVARGTVRSALAELRRDGLIASDNGRRTVAEDAAPQPAARGASLMSDAIAVMTRRVDSRITDRIRSHGWELFIERGALDAVYDAGLHAVNLYPDKLQDDALDRLIQGRPMGLVVGRLGGGDPLRVLDALREADIPAVAYGNEPAMTDFDRAYSDHQAGAAMVTRWLLEKGRRRILRVESAKQQDAYWLRMRHAGHADAMADAGVEPLEPLQMQATLSHTEGHADRFEINRRAMAGYLMDAFAGPTPPDALMLASDGDVAAAAGALKLLGRTPGQDVLIAGYDNYWADRADHRFEPTAPDVTVDKHNDQIGAALVQLLLDRVHGKLPDAPQVRLITPELIVPQRRGD